jgi:hypothetical protein
MFRKRSQNAQIQTTKKCGSSLLGVTEELLAEFALEASIALARARHAHASLTHRAEIMTKQTQTTRTPRANSTNVP